MPWMRLDLGRLPRVPEQPVQDMRGCRSTPLLEDLNETLDGMDRNRPDLDLLDRSHFEQFSGLDAAEEQRVVDQHTATTQNMRDEVVGEERETIQPREVAPGIIGEGELEISDRDLCALVERHFELFVTRDVSIQGHLRE